MATKAVQVSPRVLASRENGRKGGLARAKNLSKEQMSSIGRMGGQATAQTYGTDFFRHIRASQSR